MDYNSLFWGLGVISMIDYYPRYAYVSVINTRSFGRFWPVSWPITHCFGFSECFSRLTNPGVRLRVGYQPSQFWPILASFMDYYSLFWGPSSLFCHSGPFRGLLLTVLGSRSDFHD